MNFKSLYYFIIALVLATLFHVSGIMMWLGERFSFDVPSPRHFFMLVMSFALGFLLGKLKKFIDAKKTDAKLDIISREAVKTVKTVKRTSKPYYPKPRANPPLISDEVALQAISALTNLGYTRGMAVATVTLVGTTNDNGDKKPVEVIVKESLKQLGKSR